MIVISDASPVINLAIIEHLSLLPRLFGKVVLPRQVFDEITVTGFGMPGADLVKDADWIEIKVCRDQPLFEALKLQVDPGEAAAIALALELKADLLLIDERIGRQVAQHFQLPIMGLVGVLSLAKQKGFIENMQEILDRLIEEAKFRISPDLYREVLRNEGELPE